jgi:hypothetical protein
VACECRGPAKPPGPTGPDATFGGIGSGGQIIGDGLGERPVVAGPAGSLRATAENSCAGRPGTRRSAAVSTTCLV